MSRKPSAIAARPALTETGNRGSVPLFPELLASKGIDVPPQHVTFKQAPKHVKDSNSQLELTSATSDSDAVVVSDKPLLKANLVKSGRRTRK